MSYEELSLLNAVLARRDPSIISRLGLADESCWSDQVDAYRFIRSHVDQYGEVPSVDAVVRESAMKRWPAQFDAVDSGESVEVLAEKIHASRLKRDLRSLLVSVTGDKGRVFAETEPYELLRRLGVGLEELRQKTNARHGTHATNWTKDVEARIEEFEKRRSGIEDDAIPLFWSEIDDAVGGFHRGDYVDIEARTKGGKTWLGDHAGLTANSAGYRVLAFKAESYRREALARLDTLEFEISNRGIFSGRLDDIEAQTYVRKLKELGKANRPDYILRFPNDWPTGLTIHQIEADIEQFRPDVVIIDQFNLIRHGGHTHEDKADTSRSLKLLFARKNVVGVVLTQANGSYLKALDKLEGDDENEVRELRPPRMGDYSESVAVRQDCTHMIALDSLPKLGKAKIIVEVSRTGGEGTEVDLAWCADSGVIRPRSATDLF